MIVTVLARKAPATGRSSDPIVRVSLIAGVLLLLLLAAITVEIFLMLQEMRQLGASLPTSTPSVSRLDAMRADLDRIQPDIHQVNVKVNQVEANTTNLDPSLSDLAAKMAKLDADLVQVMSELKDVDQHVANLDRKTGPALPAVP